MSSEISKAKVLVVGAGGIGCELLKNLVLSGFQDITVVDLDTIDLSNLNRQFLFQKQHVGKSKALIAKESVYRFNPDARVDAMQANIKDVEFNADFFKTFQLVLNALDNLDARRWINKMCLACRVPLIESGTTGYLGQVQPITASLECYDCAPKATPKSYPVCTIRSTPSQPIHCIVWAKSYLLPKLFGIDDEAGEEDVLNKAEAAGEDLNELKALRQESQAFVNLKKGLQDADGPRKVFEKVFKHDIDRLLRMEDMWQTRVKPIPLLFDEIMTSEENTSNGHGLRDQKLLTLRENVELFVSSCHRLAQRQKNGESEIAFDKDDNDTLDFVLATSNIRSQTYSIPQKTRFQVKEMAGNIIPAIASVNAIIAGWLVVQAKRVLTKTQKPQNVLISRTATRFFAAHDLEKPSPECGTCTSDYALYKGPLSVTLGEMLQKIQIHPKWRGKDITITEGARVLADADFEDNLDRSIHSFGIKTNSFLDFVDDDNELHRLSVLIQEAVHEDFNIPDSRIIAPKAESKPADSDESEIEMVSPDISTNKRKREEDEITNKKRRIGQPGNENEIIVI